MVDVFRGQRVRGNLDGPHFSLRERWLPRLVPDRRIVSKCMRESLECDDDAFYLFLQKLLLFKNN
jgi:hypothetical protein